ncbi:chorismate-binding protein [Gaetbulibacter saemankumensis]|uniref:chorismate-binding protein n=1 Tax=Gaetbulibacter saemankumensis TaxID=311208 RepID=UPI000429F14D|nr:chorismate-binding protein [Gaetbulibacter saemankumensis]
MTIEDALIRIENQYKDKLPFVVYRKPKEVIINALLQKDDIVYSAISFKESGFVFSPFENIDETVLIPKEHSEIIQLHHQQNFEVDRTLRVDNSVQDETEKKHHIALVKKGIETIKAHNLEKVVLSRQEKVDITVDNPIHILKELLNAYPLAFVYCWYHPKIGLWLGATPETLIKIEGNRFSIMALAGTQVYKGTLDVEWQYKEKEEQQYVTDYVIDSLQPSAEQIKVSDTETVRAGNLVHLKTMISARLKAGIGLKEIITTIHPTPAVCGLPKAASKQFILENEPYNRSFYTGFLGELNFESTKAPRTGRRNIENRAYAINRNATQLYVNLRCMQLQDSHAIIYVGGGITKDSNPESEWQETVSKSLVIKNAL